MIDQILFIYFFAEDDLKKKWKNLRDQFRHELKKIPIRGTGDPEDSDESYSNWAHFKDLLFLKDQMKCRQLPENLEVKVQVKLFSSEFLVECI